MLNILITGHSFICQYHDYLNHSQLPQYLDLSNCLGLPEEHISIEGIEGLKANKKGITYITNHKSQVLHLLITYITNHKSQVSHCDADCQINLKIWQTNISHIFTLEAKPHKIP